VLVPEYLERKKEEKKPGIKHNFVLLNPKHVLDYIQTVCSIARWIIMVKQIKISIKHTGDT